MTGIGEWIAKLRHDRGMTQESLAEVLCVSPQTVSKWENSVNLPDVQMLPLIADVFDVRVDALFGRGERAASRPERACEDLIDAAQRIFSGLSSPAGQSLESWQEAYVRQLQDDEGTRSELCQGQELVYLREALGAAALRKPKGGWHTLLTSESAARTLSLLGDEDFRRALGCILEHRIQDFTVPFLCSRAGVKDPALLEKRLDACGLFERRELPVDDHALTFYTVDNANGKIVALLAALVWCAEFDGWKSTFCIYMNDGSIF